MELHTLQPALGSKKAKKRKGRGQGSGKGGTSTKGHKGAQSRAGYKTAPHRTSGYTPLQRSKPKFGFNRANKEKVQTISLSELEKIAVKNNTNDITRDLLRAARVVKKNQPYKILGDGTLTQKLDVHAPYCSGTAKKAIESLGGTLHTL